MKTNNNRNKHRVKRVHLFVAADLPQPLPCGLTEFCPTTNLGSETSLEDEKTGDKVETERTETNRRNVEQSVVRHLWKAKRLVTQWRQRGQRQTGGTWNSRERSWRQKREILQ